MAPFRGRGGAGMRGGMRGRGRGGMRGRGRGGARGGRKNAFAPARLEEPTGDAREESPESEAEDESESSDAISEDDEEAQPTSRAYYSLLQSLAAKNANAAKGEPRRKRRKLESDRPPSEEESDVEIEDDNEDVSMEEQDVGPTEEESEAEESGSEQATGDANQSEKDDIDESEFEAHFERPNENELAMRLKAISENKWTSTKVDTTGGRCLLQVPSSDEKALTRRRVRTTKDIRLKSRLITNAQEVLKDFTKVEQAIAPSLFGYQDVLFGARTPQNANRLRDMTCLHALNHILKTRDRILKNTSKLAAASDDLSAEYRDQGFTRPKILFLLETKQACVRAIDSITKLHDFEQQENKKRFLDNFSQPEDKFSSDKPDDFRELFEGNDENEFRIGVKLTRKTLKFYSTFYNSDIIFASALGLRRAIESPSPTSKTKDFDFLSSIEMVFMEDASATLMQNWEHADYVFEHLNLQPKETHGCDFSRVRSWYLDGHAARMRQTIVLSAYLTPKITALWNGRMRNAFGRLKYTPDYTAGLIETLPHGIKQTFSRFESKSHVSDPDARFKFFTSTVLPSITKLPKPPQGGLGVLVFIPSYLDFVRVRNALVDIDISYASISEYTDLTDVRKARSHFASGRHSLLLYTGRAHHFHRYHIRGVKRVVFYGVPENPRFYDEVVGFVGKSVERSEIGKAEGHVRVCFSRWESLELERVVGTKRVGRMIKEKGDVFDFV